MKSAAIQLKAHIPPACPLLWRPCDGSEQAIRLECGFTAKWFHDRCNIDFGNRWHTDVCYRQESLIRMYKELNTRFPSLGIGADGPENIPCTIDGLFGTVFVPALFGGRIRYFKDDWPALEHRYLAPEDVARLKPPVLDDSPLFASAVEQIHAIQNKWGTIEGTINFQGVLNTAYRLRGESILTDMITDPGLAGHLFEVVFETMCDAFDRICAIAATSNTAYFVVSNCLVNLISPGHYEEFVLPFDLKMAKRFRSFGVHNCAWCVNPYLDSYARLNPLKYLDMGLSSDLKRVRHSFPDARLGIMLTPPEIIADPSVIRKNLDKIRAELAPCDIIVADIDTTVPDETIMNIHNLCDRKSTWA